MTDYNSTKYHLHGRFIEYDGYRMGTYSSPDDLSVEFMDFDAHRFLTFAKEVPRDTVIQMMEMLASKATSQLSEGRRPSTFCEPILRQYPEPEPFETVKPLIENAQRFANDVLQALKGK